MKPTRLVLIFEGQSGRSKQTLLKKKKMYPSPGLSSSLLEKAMAPHSSTVAWKIPWTEEPGGLQSMGSQESDMT